MTSSPNPPADPHPAAAPAVAANDAPRALPPRLPRCAAPLFLAVALLTFLVFTPSLQNGFVGWDDEQNLLHNPHYRGLALQNLRWMFTTFHGGPYQPLAWITYALDYLVWGEQRPFGYHLTNLLLHAANAYLFAAVAGLLWMRQCLQAPAPQPCSTTPDAVGLQYPADAKRSDLPPSPTFAIAFGAAASLFWALHPLRAEAVTWVTERREVLCGFFFLACVLHHLRGGNRCSVAALALAALLSKGTAVVLPPLLVLADIAAHRPATFRDWLRAAPPALRRHAPLFLLAAAFALLAVLGQSEHKAVVSFHRMSLANRLDVFSRSLLFYPVKTLLPIALAPLYEAPVNLAALRNVGLAARAALLAALLAAVALRSRFPALLPLIAAYIVTLLPVGGLLQVGSQICADRYSYQPGWILTLLLVGFAAVLLRCLAPLRAQAPALLALFAVAVVPYVDKCRRMQRIWHDTVALWTHQLNVYPDTAIAHANLAIEYMLSAPGPESDAKAEPHLRKALDKFPHFVQARRELAEILTRSRRFDEAASQFELALQYDPNYAPALAGYARLHWELGRPDQALELLRRLAHIDPDQAAARSMLARALAAADHPEQAVAEYEKAIAADPADPQPLLELARLLATHPMRRVRNGPRAVQLAERAAALAGRLTAPVAETLAAACAEAGQFDRAQSVLNEAVISLPPDQAAPLSAQIVHYARREPLRQLPRFP